MTCNILVLGHIRLLKKLLKRGEVIIGLLTDKALKGYKKNVTPFRDRLEVLGEVGLWTKLVAQNSLNPLQNLKKYKCDAMASGDGWENLEIAAAKQLGVTLLTIKSGCKIHASDLCKYQK